MFELTIETDRDGEIFDFSVSPLDLGDYDTLPAPDGEQFFASEEEATAEGNRVLGPVEACPFCGNIHRADRPNPCLCQVCGQPIADGHWHPNT